MARWAVWARNGVALNSMACGVVLRGVTMKGPEAAAMASQQDYGYLGSDSENGVLGGSQGP